MAMKVIILIFVSQILSLNAQNGVWDDLDLIFGPK